MSFKHPYGGSCILIRSRNSSIPNQKASFRWKKWNCEKKQELKKEYETVAKQICYYAWIPHWPLPKPMTKSVRCRDRWLRSNGRWQLEKPSECAGIPLEREPYHKVVLKITCWYANFLYLIQQIVPQPKSRNNIQIINLPQ